MITSEELIKIVSVMNRTTCCCFLPIPPGGEYFLPACRPPARFSVHLVRSAVTPAGSVHKSRVDNVVHKWGKLKR